MNGFDGLIAWEKGSNCISWTWNEKIIGEQTSIQHQAVFQDGDSESEWHCAEQLDEWIISTPFRVQQWALIRSDFEWL